MDKAYDTTWKYGVMKDLHGFGLKGHLPENVLNYVRCLILLSSLFQGQWYNDLFHGDGYMEHASGILYSGQWVNGLPERMAAKIVITNDPPVIDIKQGETFLITVEVRDGADELVEG